MRFVCLLFIFFITNANAVVLSQKKDDIKAIWQSAKENSNKRAVLGIDIGGTKIAWSVYRVAGDGYLTKQVIYKGVKRTPKGLLELTDAYFDILKSSIKNAGDNGYLIVAVGVGSPGRFINFKPAEYSTTERIVHEIGNPFIPDDCTKKSPKKVIAKGSAVNLGKYPSEFDGFAMESVFQRISPPAVRVRVLNDAAVQLQGLYNELFDRVSGKKTIYIAPGTGLGAAVVNKDGVNVTDGHFQYIKLSKINNTPTDVDVFNIVREINAKKYNKIDPKANAILPEDIFSGNGIGNVLKKTFNLEKIPDKFDDLLVSQKNNKNYNLAIERLKSIGRYLGYFIITVRSGHFAHFDPNSEWSYKDKNHIKRFSAIIFGGGISNESNFFKEIIIPEAKSVLAEYGMLNKIDLIFPQNINITPMFASAKNVYSGFVVSGNKPEVFLTFDDGPSGIHTIPILELLKKYNLKATFFVVGTAADKHPDILLRIIEEGHSVGVHTYTHPDLTKLSDDQIRKQIQRTIDAIHKVAPNYKVKLMRPPYGLMNERVKSIVDEMGLKVILWNSLGHDYLAIATPEYIQKTIDFYLEKNHGGIVLLHDGGGEIPEGAKINPKFRIGKQNVVDYLINNLGILKEKYDIKAIN